MNIIPFPSNSGESPSHPRAVRELCLDYIHKQLSAWTLDESNIAIHRVKTYVLAVLGDLDHSEVDLDALHRLHTYVAYRCQMEAKPVLDLILEIFWEWMNERLYNESESM